MPTTSSKGFHDQSNANGFGCRQATAIRQTGIRQITGRLPGRAKWRQPHAAFIDNGTAYIRTLSVADLMNDRTSWSTVGVGVSLFTMPHCTCRSMARNRPSKHRFKRWSTQTTTTTPNVDVRNAIDGDSFWYTSVAMSLVIMISYSWGPVLCTCLVRVVGKFNLNLK
jgi:hypothetical protein